MLILEISITTECLLQLIRCEQTGFEDLGIELHLVACDGIDEGHDDFEEHVDNEGNVDDNGTTKAFGVVVLKDVKDLASQLRYCTPDTRDQAHTVRDVLILGCLPRSPKLIMRARVLEMMLLSTCSQSRS